MKKAHFKVLFWRKWQTEGPAKILGTLALAIVKASGNALMRAGKRAFDFRQPSLPGLSPGPNQDPPALPLAKGQIPTLSGTEDALSRSTDWRKSQLWMWFSGGGWKGFLGARRYWSVAARYFLDSLGRIGWTFHFTAIKPLLFATAQAARFGNAICFFRGRLHLCRIQPVHVPPKAVLRQIFLHNAIPPMVGGAALLAETVLLDQVTGLPDFLFTLSVIAGLLAVSFPVFVFEWCRGKLDNPALLAGFAIPSLVHSAPGSLAGCVLYTFFGSAAGQNTCSGSSLSSAISNSTVLADLSPAVSVVASLVSILALCLLTVTYGYHLVSAMHTAAHTGDWTHQGVNAAWAPVRGATSAAMIAAPGGLSILASFILFVAATGNGLGDTAAGKVGNMLITPKPAAVIPPTVQTVVDNALYSLVCEHVLDNFDDPKGTIQDVTPQVDNFGNIGFSNVTGVGSYGPYVCGDYMLPSGSGQTMAQNTAFTSLIRSGGPLDSIASAIASGANGCGSIVIGTGLSPCSPPGTPPNRQVFAQGGGMTNPAGSAGGMTAAITQYETALEQMAVATTSNGGNVSQEIQTDGWISLGMYYSFFGSEAQRAAKMAEFLPIPVDGFGGASWASLAPENIQELQSAFGMTSTYLSHWGFAGQTGTGPWWAAVPTPTTGPGAEQSRIAALSTVQNPTTGQSLSIPSYMSANPGEDPLSRLQAVVESADTALAVGQAATAGLGSRMVRGALFAGATALAGPGAGIAALKGSSAIAKTGQSILNPLVTVMGILTVVVAVYLPLLPMLAVLFYSLFWILEVVILAVFAPLWALAIGIPQGDGFIGQHGREGLARVTDIALRPLLLVGMFVISLGLYFLASALLVPMTSEVLSGMASNPSPGIWISAAGLIGGYLAYVLVLWRVIHFAFEVLHTGPYWAMRVLGIESRDGREGRHMEAGGREILNNIRTVFGGLRGGIPGGGKGGQA